MWEFCLLQFPNVVFGLWDLVSSSASQNPGRGLWYPTPPLCCHTLLSGHRLWPPWVQQKCHHKDSSRRIWSVQGGSEGFPQPRSPQKSGQGGGKQSTAELRLQRVCAGTCEMHQEGHTHTRLGILSCCCGNHINSNKCVVSWVRQSVAACDTLCKFNEFCVMNDLSGHLKVKVSHAKDAAGAFLY